MPFLLFVPFSVSRAVISMRTSVMWNNSARIAPKGIREDLEAHLVSNAVYMVF
jgi:hypothetical protein